MEETIKRVNNHATKKHEETQAVLKEAIQQEGSKTETQLTFLQDQVNSQGLKTATKLESIQQQGNNTANDLKDVARNLCELKSELKDLVVQVQSAKKQDRPFRQSDIDELDDNSTVANMISLESVLASESVHSPLSAGTNDDELCNQKKRSPSPSKDEETGPMKKRIKSMIGGWKNTISGKKN